MVYTLPEEIQENIDKRLGSFSLERGIQAAQALTAHYECHHGKTPKLQSDDLYRAYIALRMPATYASLKSVYAALQAVDPQYAPKNMFDIGAGPATASLAAKTTFSSLEKTCLIERDHSFIEMGKSFIASIPSLHAKWHTEDILHATLSSSYDIGVASYSLGEMEQERKHFALTLLWEKTSQYIIIVEPGTVPGYETVMQARDFLIERGGKVIAPCPHSMACPLRGKDWCHFATRVVRTRLHRQYKQGLLGYEDEKYSYIVITKNKKENGRLSRIIRAPCKRSGHVHVTVCTEKGGVQKLTLSRKQKGLYAQAKKCEWGDVLLQPSGDGNEDRPLPA